MGELEEIRKRYDRRNVTPDTTNPTSLFYEQKIRSEREDLIREIVRKRFPAVDSLKILEIGAGTAGNVPLFRSIGLRDDQIFLNELLEDRWSLIQKEYSSVQVFPGNALDISAGQKFDIIFQFTVFTSILDEDFRRELAQKMVSLLKTGGLIIWYDFIYNNPANPDVRGVSRKEVIRLFKEMNVRFHRVTLAPPIGRRVGRLYSVLNGLFPFLRTHVVAEIS